VNKFKQHIPNFCTGIDIIPDFEFKTTEDLLSLEVVKQYSSEKHHEHFCMSGNMLMQIKDNGFLWWVIGYIENPNEINLPKWGGPKYKPKGPE